MEWVQRVRKTDLARNTSEVLRGVMRGQTALIESHGKAEAAIIDIVDYLILRAVMRYYKNSPAIEAETGLPDATFAELHDPQARYDAVIEHYLAGAMSLSRVAELLKLPEFDLRLRFVRLDVPLRLGPATVDDALDEVQVALGVNRRAQP